MADRFQNKYRIPSARLQTWNYGNAGMYFITICTKNREFYFGEIVNDEMKLSELGKIAETEWIKTIELRPDMNLEMGEFVVMPNHMHGIILIGENKYNSGNHRDDHNDPGGRDAMHCVSKGDKHTDANNKNKPTNQFGPQSKNLASILRGYKSAVTMFARKKIFYLIGSPVTMIISSGLWMIITGYQIISLIIREIGRTTGFINNDWVSVMGRRDAMHGVSTGEQYLFQIFLPANLQ